MRIALVLSQLTYVPNNCSVLIEKVLKEHSEHFVGVIFLRTINLDVLFQIPRLYAIGCPRIASSLLKNLFSLILDKRKAILRRYGIPVITAKSMNQPTIVDWVKENKVDCIINVRTRCIYRKEILSTPTSGCYNIHHGLLPKYRGMYCDLYALYENRPAGISLHKMNEKIDDGEIISVAAISDNREKDYIHYLSKTGAREANLIHSFIKKSVTDGKTPVGKRGSAEYSIYTTTPTLAVIRKMQHDGMLL